MERKIYEVKGMDKCNLSTTYRGVKVNLEFKGGDVSSRKNGSLSTSDPFVQDAIESMPAFGKKIVLKDTYEIRNGSRPIERQKDTEEEKRPRFAKTNPNAAALRKGKKVKEEAVEDTSVTVVEEVKNVNDAAAYFEEKGVLVESREHLKEMMQKHDVEFPNLVME